MDALTATFPRFFEVTPAVTEEQLHAALQVRYQVYCLETGFEHSEQHPNGLERDEFDHRSVHSLLIHRPSGMVAGTVRLVLPDQNDHEADFPIEKYCNGISLPAGAQRSRLAEISRFCVSKEFKRRMAESPTLWGTADVEEDSVWIHRRLIPHITVGLFSAIVHMSVQRRIRYWYAVMEPALLRLLKRFGIHFLEIGPAVDYHGLRQPCFGAADQILSQMHAQCRPVWELITESGALWPLDDGRQATVAVLDRQNFSDLLLATADRVRG